MLDETGRMEFTGEVADLVERLWCTYREAVGPSGSRAEYLAGLAYIIAVLRQDVEGIWLQLAAAPELQGLDLVGLLQEELGPLEDERGAAVQAELQRRGWLTGRSIDT